MLILVLVLFSCQKDKEKELRQSVQSWRGTLDLVQSQRARNNVPQKYVEQVGKEASQSLEKELKNSQTEISDRTRKECLAVIARADDIGGGKK